MYDRLCGAADDFMTARGASIHWVNVAPCARARSVLARVRDAAESRSRSHAVSG